MSKIKGHRFDAFDRPVPRQVTSSEEQENEGVLTHNNVDHKGKFF